MRFVYEKKEVIKESFSPVPEEKSSKLSSTKYASFFKDKEVKMIPEMLNLLGCNKENFKKLLKNMNYKIIEKNNEVFFKYFPPKNKRIFNKKATKESPFGVLKNILT